MSGIEFEEYCKSILEENKSKIQALKNQHAQRTNEFNETLGGMLDGAMLLDLNHTITFSNQSANDYFSGGEPLTGRRLEAFIDSSQLLEMIDKIKSETSIKNFGSLGPCGVRGYTTISVSTPNLSRAL